MKKVLKKFWEYWTGDPSNIFDCCPDALGGLVVLVILPLLSLVSLKYTKDTTWWTYSFPISSIAVAGLYDTYGRFGKDKNDREAKKERAAKLWTRSWINLVALIVSNAVWASKSIVVKGIAPVLLAVSGMSICIDIFYRVKRRIELRR